LRSFGTFPHVRVRSIASPPSDDTAAIVWKRTMQAPIRWSRAEWDITWRASRRPYGRSRNREHLLVAYLPRISYISHSLAREGRLPGGVWQAGGGAAPAGGARIPALGRPRDPPAGHYEPAARCSLMRAGAPAQ